MVKKEDALRGGKFRPEGAGHLRVGAVERGTMIRWIETHVSLSVRAGLALFGAVLLWSSSFIALKVAVAAFDPMVMVFGRMVSSLAALVLLRFTVCVVPPRLCCWIGG